MLSGQREPQIHPREDSLVDEPQAGSQERT